MKTRKLTTLSIVLLATIILGAVVVTVLSGPVPKLKVKWTPANYTLDNNPPDSWNAGLSFAPPRPLEEVDVTTLKLEGLYDPADEPYISASNRLVVPFSGDDVLTCLLVKLPHMGPGEYRIYLEVSGELTDGTPISGGGGINIIVPELPPP